MSLPRSSRVFLPAALASLPLLVQAGRALSNRIWLWGDQALIDLEARNSLTGHNLLGVYDRYGWHHLGPMWLLLLGVFRWMGGGSAAALVFGAGVLLAAAAAAIVVVADRLRPGLTAWWAALLVVAFEWAFGADRFGTVWAPYTIALPAALLVLLVADVATSDNPWGPTLGLAICATFLLQTDISTAVVVAALVVVTPLVRALAWSGRQPGADASLRRRRGRLRAALHGKPLGNWRRGLVALAGTLGLFWLPPAINLVAGNPSNVGQVLNFMSTHPGHHSGPGALRAMDTIFGSFPFRTGARYSNLDAKTTWLLNAAAWDHPWFVLYLLITVAAGLLALRRGLRPAAALAAATVVAMLAGFVSVLLVYGSLYPYLVLWMSALAVPAWAAWALAVAPARGVAGARAQRYLDRLARLTADRRTVVPTTCILVAAAVTSSFSGGQLPMAGVERNLGYNSWRSVAAAISAPGVRTVYIDIVNGDAMPDAAAIADEAAHKGRRVEINRSALYFVDSSFAPRYPAQVDVVVCCGTRDRAVLPRGMKLRRKVGGQAIYISTDKGLYRAPVKVSRRYGVWDFRPKHHRHKHRRPATGRTQPVPVAERPLAERPLAEGPLAEGPLAERPLAEGHIAGPPN